MTRDWSRLGRLPLLVLGMLALLAGVLGGLARLGFEVPAVAASQAGLHAALMIGAFFGTVISLERAVALQRGWAYLAPASAGLAGVLLMTGTAMDLARWLLIVAASLLTAGCIEVMRRQTALFTAMLAVGSACWLAGNIAWLVAGDMQAAVPWWLSFLVLTIAGERLELTRFLPARREAAALFVGAVAIVLCGAVLATWREDIGLRVFAGGLFALALWLLRYDIARHNARQQGLTRFIAICLLSGYAWLTLAALLGLAGGFAPGHALRDAAVHGLALGFVFSMVFGHAPIIFPAVLRVSIPYHPFFYVPLAALHASLALRLAGMAGDGFALRQNGALLNALTLVLFVATMLASVIRGSRRKRPARPTLTERAR